MLQANNPPAAKSTVLARCKDDVSIFGLSLCRDSFMQNLDGVHLPLPPFCFEQKLSGLGDAPGHVPGNTGFSLIESESPFDRHVAASALQTLPMQVHLY